MGDIKSLSVSQTNTVRRKGISKIKEWTEAWECLNIWHAHTSENGRLFTLTKVHVGILEKERDVTIVKPF